MWAASLRYHEGRFCVCFVANDTRKTYLYTSEKVDGPWKKQLIEGFYHDGSLLFDEDGRNYIVYGNDEIWITELNERPDCTEEGRITSSAESVITGTRSLAMRVPIFIK